MLLFENKRNNIINEKEQEIIVAYNSAAPAIQEAVKKLLDISDEKKIIRIKDWIRKKT